MIDLLKALERHNDPNDPFHLDMHEVVSLGAQFKGGVKFAAFATAHQLLHIGSSIQSGWEVQVSITVLLTLGSLLTDSTPSAANAGLFPIQLFLASIITLLSPVLLAWKIAFLVCVT